MARRTGSHRRISRRLRTLAIVLFVGLSGVAAAGPTNQDVVEMTKAGIAEETILRAIETADRKFDTTAKALIDLKKAGVSERVIQAILGNGQSRVGVRNGAEPAQAPRELGTAVAAPAPPGQTMPPELIRRPSSSIRYLQ